MLDVDRFKSVNDTFGHPAGDAVLVAIADALVRSFPARTDLVARIGGEEIGVLAGRLQRRRRDRLAGRALAAIRALAVEHDGRTMTVTASIGVAEMAPLEDAASWLARADRAGRREGRRARPGRGGAADDSALPASRARAASVAPAA